MKFCPKCEVKLRRGIDGLSCSKCGYSEDSGKKQSDDSNNYDDIGATALSTSTSSNDVRTNTDSVSAQQQQETTTTTTTETSGSNGLEVFDDTDEDTRSTIKIECEKCGNDEAVWWMLQTRSADEPTTQFYRCTKCQYTWRDYS